MGCLLGELLLFTKLDKSAPARTENKMLLSRRAGGTIPAADYKNKFTLYAKPLHGLGQLLPRQ
jgi:hypothetical protein